MKSHKKTPLDSPFSLKISLGILMCISSITGAYAIYDDAGMGATVTSGNQFTSSMWNTAVGNIRDIYERTQYLNTNGGGNTGIGTASPGAKLDVAGNIRGATYGAFPQGIVPALSGAPDGKIFSPSGDYIGGSTWGINYNEGSPDYIEFNNNSSVTSRISLDNGDAHFGLNGGNMGIGTNSPVSKLEVNGSIVAGDSNGYGLFIPKPGTTPFGTNYDRFEARVDTLTQATFIGNTHGGTGVARDMGIIAGNTERIRVNATNGNVGIGTTAPAKKLDVVGDVGLTGTYFQRNTSPTITLQDTDNRSAMIHNNSNMLYFLRGCGNDSTTWCTTGGYWPLYLNLENNDAVFGGSVYSFSYYYNSDIRLKKNIVPLTGALEKILQLGGYTYEWKSNGKKTVGVIAQEVEKVFPELVGSSRNGDGEIYKSVEYGNLVAPLIESIKELAGTNNNQTARIERLEKENKELKRQMEEILANLKTLEN